MMCKTPKFILNYLASFGEVTERQMFGGYGVFCEGVFFGYFINDVFHLRSGTDNGAQFKLMGCKPYLLAKKTGYATTRFYPVPEAWWGKSEPLNKEIEKSLIRAKKDKADGHAQKVSPKKIKDLPNMNARKARMVRNAGVLSVEELRRIGAAGTFSLMKSQYPTLKMQFLYELEGALTGQFWSVVTLERRSELLKEVDELRCIVQLNKQSA